MVKNYYKRQRLYILAKILFQLIVISLYPILLISELRQEVWEGMRPAAWDGSGHFTLAQIYNNTIFPDVFGWTNAFFGGMPHPNNYPPLFYWLVALLEHSHLFSFLTSFKILLLIPTLLLPAATWFLAWKVSNKNEWIAFISALAVTPLLVDYRFFISSGPLGISYISTFLTGLYSHPLGYLFLILWLAVYSDRQQPLWRIALTAFLHAGAVLSSFFGASVTALFIVVTLIYDLMQLRLARDLESRKEARQSLIGHFVSPIMACSLTLFWLIPVLATRDYIITQPSSIPLGELLPPALLVWYGIAGVGIILWIRQRECALIGVYLAACVALAMIIFSAGAIAPRWFPLHPARLLATLNFLLAVPVGLALTFFSGKLAQLLGVTSLIMKLTESLISRQKLVKEESSSPNTLSQSLNQRLKSWQLIGIIVLLFFGMILIFKGIKAASYQLAFYPTENREAIDPLLNFARDHKEGRYLVEIPPFSDITTGHEGRAINNFLPLHGNEVLTLFFREASPSVVFFSPIVDRFSVQADPSGISSVLSDDIDFANQTTALHIQQARLFGVRYLVIRSPWARKLLQGQSDIKSRRDLGLWSIYELNGEPEQPVRPFAYKPALVVSDLNLKGRRHNALDFVRFAEEQIYSGWFDVMLARSPETKLDKINLEDGFGALIVDTYDYESEQTAYERLHQFAQNKKLILLEDNNPLFHRIQSAIGEFPNAAIINRVAEEPGEWLKPSAPTRSYESSQIRQIWRQIQQILDRNKIPTSINAATELAGQMEQNKVIINRSTTTTEAIPVLVNMTYHPNWQRSDEGAIYPVTPFFMLTFVREQTQLEFSRKTIDWIGLAISATTFLLICVSLIWHYGYRFAYRVKASKSSGAAATVLDNKDS